MLNIHINENGEKYVIASELYEVLELSKSHFSKITKRWFEEEYEFQDNTFRKPIQGKDFSQYSAKSTGGRKKHNYILSLELSKLIALDSRSRIKKKYAKWLLSLEKKVKNLEYLSVDQVAVIYRVLNFFRYITHQKAMLENHKERFVQEFNKKGNPYAQFNVFRNQLLDIGKEELKKRVIEYCKKEGRSIKLAKKDKFTQIHSINPYDTLAHAVIDWLYTQDKAGDVLKLANIVKRIAKQVDLQFEIDNTTNLFHVKQTVSLPLPQKLLSA